MLSDVLYIGGWIKRNKFKIPIALIVSLVLFTGIRLSFAGGYATGGARGGAR